MKITFSAGPVSVMNIDGKTGSGVQVSFSSLLLGSAGAAGSTETGGQIDSFYEKTEYADPELADAFKELIKELAVNEAVMPEGTVNGLQTLTPAAEHTISEQTKTGLGRFLIKETETAAEQADYPEKTAVKVQSGAGEIIGPESKEGFAGGHAPKHQAETGGITKRLISTKPASEVDKKHEVQMIDAFQIETQKAIIAHTVQQIENTSEAYLKKQGGFPAGRTNTPPPDGRDKDVDQLKSQLIKSISHPGDIMDVFSGKALRTFSAGGTSIDESSEAETFNDKILAAIKQAINEVLKAGPSQKNSLIIENMNLNNQPDRTIVNKNAIDKLTAILKPLHRIFSAGGEQGLARLIEEISAAVRTDSDRTISSLKNLQSQLEGDQLLQVLQKASYTEQPAIGRLPLKKEIEAGGGKQEAVHQLLSKGYFRPTAAEGSNGTRPQAPDSIGNFQADLKQLEVNVTENHMRSPGLTEMKNEWQQLFNKDGNSTVHQPAPGLTEVKLSASPELKEHQDEPVKREFSAQITEVFKRAKPAFALNGFSQMTIRLAPEHLGLLTVKLQRLNGETTAKIITSTSSAKELVEHSIQHLKAALPAFQIAVDRFDIYGEQPDSFRDRDQDERQPEKEQGEEKDRPEEPDSFKDHLNMLT
ncbi:flagellar hook-length control protein FliK [Metabacillus sp. JX24]|uniref:flagellar hook-length control protein FliK n=1 Tax=Metabacillus sp. JX24 TaxID=3240759 RepID=UPI003510463A